MIGMNGLVTKKVDGLSNDKISVQLFKELLNSDLVQKMTIFDNRPAQFILKNGEKGSVLITEDRTLTMNGFL